MTRQTLKVYALLALVGVMPTLACSSAAAPSTAPGKYSSPDGTASVQLPTGWKVLQAANGTIQASGPQGESANLGTTLQVRNGPLQLSGTALDLPNQGTLAQKLNAMVVLGKQDPAASSSGQVQNTLMSQASIKVPATVGQCGRFLFGSTRQGAAATDSEAVLCSTPVNAAGFYNLIYVGVTVPAGQAQQERAMLEALLGSFTVTKAAMQSKLTIAAAPAAGSAMPAAAPVPASAASQAYMQQMQAGIANEETATILRETATAQRASDFGANCEDDLLTNNNYNFYHTGC